MTNTLKGFFALMIVFHFGNMLFKMIKARWICRRCRDGDYQRAEEPDKFWKNFDNYSKILFHNLDLISDILYLFTVPIYTTWI